MKKVALVTGILGQDGPYLAKHLLEKGYEVYGLIRRYSNPGFENLDYLGITKQVELVVGDMCDESSIISLVKDIRPDMVFNMAGQSHVPVSFDQPKFTTEVNSMGVLYFLNAIKNYAPECRIAQASTSEMFGNSTTGIIDESTPFRPCSPYAISKVYAFNMMQCYRESYKMFCSNSICFNHEGPLRSKSFLTRKVTDAVARIRLGKQDKVVLGNLDAMRDWGSAEDYMRGVIMMLEHNEPGDFCFCTGETHSVREFVEKAFAYVGIENWQDHVETNPHFLRPSEVNRLQGSYDKALNTLDWTPTVKFDQLVAMMVDADLKRVEKEL